MSNSTKAGVRPRLMGLVLCVCGRTQAGQDALSASIPGGEAWFEWGGALSMIAGLGKRRDLDTLFFSFISKSCSVFEPTMTVTPLLTSRLLLCCKVPSFSYSWMWILL